MILGALTASCGARTSFFDPADYPDGYIPTDASETGVDRPVVDVPPTCAAPLSLCNTRCVNPRTDPLNCGACGVVCVSGSVCSNGACLNSTCPTPLTNCGGGCTDPRSDPTNCGACGRRCATGTVCQAGACVARCGMPLTFCPSGCVNPNTDPNNCGGCNNVCLAGSRCVNGICQSACGAGLVMCPSGCASLLSDPSNCGACNRLCPPDRMCSRGDCVPRTVYPEFSIGSLTDQRCVTTEHNMVTGDDRGGIAITPQGVLYTGDMTTGRFDLETLGATALPMALEPMIEDLATQRVYLLSAGGVGARPGTNADALIQIDPTRGAMIGLTRLSRPITLGDGVRFGIGFFSGYGRLVVSTGTEVLDINPATGVVSTVGGIMAVTHTPCETFGYWGVAETIGGRLQLAYVQDSRTVVRWDPATGTTSIVAMFVNLSDMCSFTVSAGAQRWYFHHEGGSQFRSGDETIGYCDATINTTGAVGTYTVTAPSIPWIDACAAPGARTLLPRQDDAANLVPLPFDFRYWGTVTSAGSMVNVTTNGWLSFDALNNAQISGMIPQSGDANGVMAVYWGDNFTRDPGMCVATVGTAPNRSFVVEWNDEHFCCMEDPMVHLTYEAVLHEGSNVIEFLYNTMTGARSQVVGLEDRTGTRGVSVCAAGEMCSVTTGSRLRFTPTM